MKGHQSGSCNFETLLCARVGFNFWHLITYYSYSLLAFRTDGHFLSHVGNVQKRKSSFSGGEGRKKKAACEINLYLSSIRHSPQTKKRSDCFPFYKYPVLIFRLLLTFRSEHYQHSFTFHLGHAFQCTYVLQTIGKFQ
ncbi:hypothetical protein BH11BAC5_BH11BAC5_34780 [soil metagenome]